MPASPVSRAQERRRIALRFAAVAAFALALHGRTVPADAMIRCPLAAPCTSPTVLFRGHETAHYFAQDATAFYWTIANFGAGQGFSVSGRPPSNGGAGKRAVALRGRGPDRNH